MLLFEATMEQKGGKSHIPLSQTPYYVACNK